MVHPVRAIDLRGVSVQYATVVTSKRCNILVLGAATETGARLELRTLPLGMQEPEALRVDIEVRDSQRIVMTNGDDEPRELAAWAMACGFVHTYAHEVMGEVIAWARNRIAPRRDREGGFERTSLELQPLREVIYEVASAALDRCDDDALALAREFDTFLRFSVYKRLVADSSGRLADLVKSCPGALIFALSLIEHDTYHGGASTGERLLSDVIAGRRLNHALDDAIDGWIASISLPVANRERPRRRRARVVDRTERIRLALLDALPLRAYATVIAAESRASLRARQRLLIRRASAEVPTLWMWLPPPLVLVPEDIPRDERDNARWFFMMKSHVFTFERHPDIDPRWQDAVSRFLSRHAATLARTTETAPAMPVSAVLQYAHAEGRWLDRDSDPERVRAGWVRWHRTTRQTEDLALLAARLQQRGIAQAHALPAPLFDARLACNADLDLEPITSIAGLFAEAREMEHCIAHHVFRALAGNALVFRGVVHGERVTVELARDGSRPSDAWKLGDLRRARNQAPSATAIAAIRAWAAKAIAWQDMAEIVSHARVPKAPVVDECPF